MTRRRVGVKFVRAVSKAVAIAIVSIIVVGIVTLVAVLKSSSNAYQQYPTYSFGTFGYYLRNPTTAAPTGLGAFGLQKTAGLLRPYVVETNKMAASAQIASLGAYNASLPSGTQYGANLQLNCMLVINTSTGIQVYWLQDTSRFNTQTLEANSPRDTIYNLTTFTSGLDAVGNGSVSLSGGQYSYMYGNSQSSYSLPMTLTLAISVIAVQDGVQIDFYNSPFGGGTFDAVSLRIPDVVSAAIVVTPYDLAFGLSYDAELVWTGYCCSYTTSFTQMNSSLSLWYYNSGGQASYFPAYYSFGSETGEKAANLVMLSTSTGGEVSIGHQENNLLP